MTRAHEPVDLANKHLSRASLSRHHIEKTRARRRSDLQSPQTVLKTAGLASTHIRDRSPKHGWSAFESITVRGRPYVSACLAVILAVNWTGNVIGVGPHAPGTLSPRSSSVTCRSLVCVLGYCYPPALCLPVT